ncbi:putative holin-like toxin [Paenibacillus sp. S29]
MEVKGAISLMFMFGMFILIAYLREKEIDRSD